MHYYGDRIQSIEYMQAIMNPIEFQGFLKGNILKYISRAGRKPDVPTLDDLKKAKRYLEWLIATHEGKLIDPRK